MVEGEWRSACRHELSRFATAAIRCAHLQSSALLRIPSRTVSIRSLTARSSFMSPPCSSRPPSVLLSRCRREGHSTPTLPALNANRIEHVGEKYAVCPAAVAVAVRAIKSGRIVVQEARAKLWLSELSILWPGCRPTIKCGQGLIVVRRIESIGNAANTTTIYARLCVVTSCDQGRVAQSQSDDTVYSTQ